MSETERLLLRMPVNHDLNSLFEIYGDPRTNLSNPSGPLADLEKTTAVLQRWITHWNTNNFGMWTITTKENPDLVIGFGGLSLKNYGITERLNLGYRFAVNAWGKGYATELALGSLNYAFHQLRQPAVYAVVRPQNTTSIKVLEKTGMLLSGTLDDVPGQPQSLVYQINNPSLF